MSDYRYEYKLPGRVMRYRIMKYYYRILGDAENVMASRVRDAIRGDKVSYLTL